MPKAMSKDAAEKIDELLMLIEPWLPNATIDEIRLQTSCGCYSEYTQEPCFYDVTFIAPRPEDESDEQLSKRVSLIEKQIARWLEDAYSWSGCSCCCADGDEDKAPTPDVRVRRAK